MLCAVVYSTISFAAVPPASNLFTAINNQNLPAVQQYIAAKGNVNVNMNGMSALMIAVNAGPNPTIALNIVKALIAAGANVNVIVGGQTPLLAAVGNQNINLGIVNALIAAGANVNAVYLGYSVLMIAVQMQNLSVVNALIAAKANVNFKSPSLNNLTALQVAERTPTTSALIIKALKAAGAK